MPKVVPHHWTHRNPHTPYRSEEELLGQAFYTERRRKFDWTLDQIQGIWARTLRCKSKVVDQFEWVFIPPIKVTAQFFAPIKTGEIPTVGLPSRCPTWGAQEPPEFNEDSLCIPKRQKRVLGKQKGPDVNRGQDLTSH